MWGEELSKAVVPNSAYVYRYDQDLAVDQDTLNKVGGLVFKTCQRKMRLEIT